VLLLAFRAVRLLAYYVVLLLAFYVERFSFTWLLPCSEGLGQANSTGVHLARFSSLELGEFREKAGGGVQVESKDEIPG
jgi:hypothetical protein